MQRIPARKLTRSSVKNIVRFPAIKSNGGKSILVESILESEYCLHLEFDPKVVTYFPQPKTFSVPGQELSSRYTPDFEVHYLSGKCSYVEVKPLEKASRESYQDLFPRFGATLVDTNYSFITVDELQIRQQPLLSNYGKLYQFRKRPTLDKRNLYTCSDLVNGKVPLSVLISKLDSRATLREIYSWLALGYLTFDIANNLLSMTTEVQFNVD
jgi:hypothetical protein